MLAVEDSLGMPLHANDETGIGAFDSLGHLIIHTQCRNLQPLAQLRHDLMMAGIGFDSLRPNYTEKLSPGIDINLVEDRGRLVRIGVNYRFPRKAGEVLI